MVAVLNSLIELDEHGIPWIVGANTKVVEHTTHQIAVATAIAAIPPHGPAGRKNSAISRPVA